MPLKSLFQYNTVNNQLNHFTVMSITIRYSSSLKGIRLALLNSPPTHFKTHNWSAALILYSKNSIPGINRTLLVESTIDNKLCTDFTIFYENIIRFYNDSHKSTIFALIKEFNKGSRLSKIGRLASIHEINISAESISTKISISRSKV